MRVKDEMMKLGGEMNLYDQALFTWHEKGELIGILVSHVDDFVYGGNSKFHQTVILKILKMFKISAQSSCIFKYLGLNVKQVNGEIRIDQVGYIDSLELTKIEDGMNNERLLNANEKNSLRSLGCQIAWVVGQTRPDIAFESCQISNYGKCPTVQHLKDANKTIHKIKKVGIVISRIKNMKSCEIVCYADATHASLKCGSSQGAYIIFLTQKDTVIPICWQSKKLQRVTKSLIASETLALSEGVDASFLLASIIQEIYLLDKLPKITCIIDNKSLF